MSFRSNFPQRIITRCIVHSCVIRAKQRFRCCCSRPRRCNRCSCEVSWSAACHNVRLTLASSFLAKNSLVDNISFAVIIINIISIVILSSHHLDSKTTLACQSNRDNSSDYDNYYYTICMNHLPLNLSQITLIFTV